MLLFLEQYKDNNIQITWTRTFDLSLVLLSAFQRETHDPLLRIRIVPGDAYRQCLLSCSLDLGICSFVIQWLSE
jgi:hypothetical protein